MTYEEAYTFLNELDQTHLLHFYETLNLEGKRKLLEQIAQLSPDSPQFQALSDLEQKRGTFAPLGALTLAQIREKEDEYRRLGLEAIRDGKLGCVLLAGGQGSRLGFAHPKGMYNIGKTRTLYIFECLMDHLKDVAREAKAYIPLMIMTSVENDAETKAFFEEQHYFGYSPDNVLFFTQETEPAVDENGKLLLKAPDEILATPNGNGGWFSSMQKAGLLQMIEECEIEWLNVFAVDNVLQRMADPVFLGATIASGCVSGSKVVAKADPDERVGVLCLEDGKPSIAEYYEMTEEMRTRREADGTLSYRFGVILNYLFRVDSLRQTLDSDFPLHVAHKKISHLGTDGQTVTPDQPNAYKFETLVLDMVHMQDSCLAFEVDREKEFAPVKNATGVDSVDTARELLEKNGVVL